MCIVNFPILSRAHPPPDLCAIKLPKPSALSGSFLKLPTAAAGRKRSWRGTQTPAQHKRSFPASCFRWETTGRRPGRTLAPHSHARHGGGREQAPAAGCVRPGPGGGAAAEDEHTVPPSGGAGQARLAESIGGRAHSARGSACGLPEPTSSRCFPPLSRYLEASAVSPAAVASQHGLSAS